MVTGGSGFIGTNFINLLKRNGFINICNIDIVSPKIEQHLNLWRNCDIRDQILLKKILDQFQPDYIVHLAAKTDLDGKSIDDYNSITEGTLNLINIANQLNVKNFIHASTRLVNRNGFIPNDFFFHNPDTLYGESKAVAENFFFSQKVLFPFVIVRPTSIWGPYFSEPFLKFFRSIIGRYYFNPVFSKTHKTLGYVENTCEQLLYLLRAKKYNRKITYLGDAEPVEIYTFANLINSELGRKLPILKLPKMVTYVIAIFCEYFLSNPPLTRFRLSNISKNSVYKIDIKIKKIVSLRRGIILTLDWIRKND